MDTPPEDPGFAAAEKARLDELFAALSDQSHHVEAIQPAEFRARRQRCGKLLADAGLDALVMEGGATMRYLADVDWRLSERLFALVLLADGSHFWVCPSFEAGSAALKLEGEGRPGGEVVLWDEHQYPYAPLAAALAARGVQRVGVEGDLRHRFVHGLAQAHGAARVAIALEVVIALRGVKDAHELQLLRRANELTQQAIVAVSHEVRPGMLGSQIARMMCHAQERLGLRDPWVLALIGEAAALPHGGLGERPLAAGDVLLVDTGGALHGYQSDNTRSWVPEGAVPSEVAKVWRIVNDAQKAAYAAIRPDALCGSVDRAARAVIEAAGYGPGYRTFGHRLGHGIGTVGHEDPYFDGGSEVVMASGMTFSNEPGIYLPGRFGIRIEDIVQVTENGADHFGNWQAGPDSPAAVVS